MLLHGFPEDWYAYHNIMPRLAKKFTVIAVDLRGVGHSEVTPDGYDAANMSEDIFQLAQDLDSPKFYLVGHDVGGMVAYALARRHPEILRGVMILETPLQGIDVADEVNARLWHIGFQQMPDLPEKMIAGREAIYFREAFFNTGTLNHQALSDADVRRYANSYSAPDHLHAGLGIYRAFPVNKDFNTRHRSRISLPLVLVGADSDNGFGQIFPDMATELRTYGWSKIKTELIKNSGHYVLDEQPEIVADFIERYASSE
jgi:pimeloyl-ACP methyl ester carboxylesterase